MGRGRGSVPSMNKFMRPILEYAGKRAGEFTLREATKAMEGYFNLTSEAKREETREGNANRVYDRTSWSINPHMKEAGLLRSTRWGYYEITELGKQELLSSSEEITTTYLLKFPGYRRWKARSRKKT